MRRKIMEEREWRRDIFYQIYPASFKDSNNDGIGDIQGIIEKLDYLKDLGVNTIWLSPIYQSPMIDNGYDISDYYAVNPMFGTMKDFDELLAKVHEKGMRLIMDLVVNHTSDQHHWFKEALKNPDSKYRNYYIFKKGKDGNPPNNWRSNFGYGSAWTAVGNDEYYLHVFSKHQPDLNWENPELRNEVYKMINWWLDKGVDGFRIDAITFIKKDQDFASLPADDTDGLVKIKRKSENRPGIQAFLQEMKQKCFAGRDIVTVGETSGLKYSDFKNYIGKNGVFSMAFDFHYADIDVESGSEWYKRTNWTAKELKHLIDESQTSIENVDGGLAANFLENHDQPRSVSKYIRSAKYQRNGIGAKALAMMYFFLRGCPFIYQGQELGLLNVERKNIDEFNDVSTFSNYYQMLKLGISEQDALHYVNLRSRDNARVPFPWNDQVNNGFNDGHAPWLKLGENDLNQNVASEKNDQDSVLNFYKELIKIRNDPNNQKDLIDGDYKVLETSSKDLVAYQRGENTKVFVNLSENNIPLDVNYDEKVIISNYEDQLKKRNILRPYESILVKRERENG